MSMLSPPFQERPKAEWTPTRDAYFAGLLIEQQNLGKRTHNGFKKEAWRSMVANFNTKFSQQFHYRQLKHHYAHLKRQYNIVKELLHESGFSWDEAKQKVSADDDCWDRYLLAHSEANAYRTKGFPLYTQLAMIFKDTLEENVDSTRTLRSPVGCNTPLPAHEAMHKESDSSLEQNIPAERLKAEWTPSRDAYLIELLIEQQNLGKKMHKAFDKEAWRSVVANFNRKFNLQFGVGQLKNHYNNLKKQYNFVKELLDQIGFSWDETRQMVIASDDVWDRYLLEHCEAKTYRTKSFPLYKQLGIILGGTIAEGRIQLSSIHPIEMRTLQSPVASTTPLPTADAMLEDSQSSSEQDIPLDDSHRNKRRSVTPPPSSHYERRVRLSAGNRIADALQEMVSSSRLEARQSLVWSEEFSYSKCLKELQEMEGLDDTEFVRAVNVLKDEKNAVAFITLKGPRRLIWLKSMCA